MRLKDNIRICKVNEVVNNTFNYCLENILTDADDLYTVYSVYLTGTNMNEMYDVLKAEFVLIGEWLLVNRLSLNIDKTSYLIATNRFAE